MSVRKAIIPAAGLGTRLRPVTDLTPKELLPIGLKPSLFFVLEEAVTGGVEEIILVVSEEKKPMLERVPFFFPDLKFHFPVQEKPLGLGDAILCGETAVGDEPFLVLLPDVLVDADVPATTQLIQAFEKSGCSIDGVQRMPPENLPLYGVHQISSSEGPLHQSIGVVEKPPFGKAPSDYAVLGRYLFTPEIFAAQKTTGPGKNGEIQLAEAMNILAAREKLAALEIEGKTFDIGTPKGYAKAQHYYGVKEYGKSFY